jgi:pyrroline-5-carboxylate reductase
MNATIRLLFVGGGKMAEALLGGILAGLPASEHSTIAVVETLPARRDYLCTAFPGITVAESLNGLVPDAAVIAVKPGDVQSVCDSLRSALNAANGATQARPRVLSIAAGVSIEQLESWLGEGFAVVRSMPNTPALVGQGAAALAGGTTASPDDVEWAASLLSTVGIAVVVPEAKLDAVTGLSGSGPAYVFLVAEALIEAGVFVGLTRDVAEALAKQTLLGAATLLTQSNDDAPTLRANVTSPGGTTAAGLRALESHGVRAAFIDAVVAATNRSVELRG